MRRRSDSNIVYISVRSLTCLLCHLLEPQLHSQYATGYRLDDGGIRALQPIQPPGAVSPGVKWLTIHLQLLPWLSIHSLPRTSVWHSA
jgi:hypothetical protein